MVFPSPAGGLALKQQSFSSLEQAHKKKRTKREVFLGEMEAVVPWARLEALIAPHYTKPGMFLQYLPKKAPVSERSPKGSVANF